MPPPTMRPVPAGAGLRITRPPSQSPATSCGIVTHTTLPWASFSTRRVTGCMALRAASPPLRIASETSLALPKPTPTLPSWSPTTMTAEKDMRRPPLTVLAQRLTNTTFSSRSSVAPDSLRRFSRFIAIIQPPWQVCR